MQKEQVNKSIILDFYRRVVGQGDLDFANDIISDDYIQHSLHVKPGKAGLLEALAYMKQMPKPASTSPPFMRLIAEADYVITNMAFNWDGKQKAVIDLFRLQDGKIVEHWDAMQDQPETSLNRNSLMDGPMPFGDEQFTIDNKTIVKAFFKQVIENQNLDGLGHYVAENLIQHRSDIANGLAGLTTYWQQKRTMLTINVQRIIAEADFVVVQYEGNRAEDTILFYDIFRLSGGKIVEQWGLWQAIS